MTMLKKLDTFIVRDQFNWSRQQVLDEANTMAIRHSDIMGWESVEIKDITEIPAKDGQYLCYKFEIWGLGTSNVEGSEDDTTFTTTAQQTPQKVAKQPEL